MIRALPLGDRIQTDNSKNLSVLNINTIAYLILYSFSDTAGYSNLN